MRIKRSLIQFPKVKITLKGGSNMGKKSLGIAKGAQKLSKEFSKQKLPAKIQCVAGVVGAADSAMSLANSTVSLVANSARLTITNRELSGSKCSDQVYAEVIAADMRERGVLACDAKKAALQHELLSDGSVPLERRGPIVNLAVRLYRKGK